MENIFLDSSKLEQIILSLEEDNNNIDEIIKKMQLEIKKLDNMVWQSSEKEKLDEKYVSYFQMIENGLKPYLQECSNFVKNAALKYQQTNDILTKKTSYLDDGNLGDV